MSYSANIYVLFKLKEGGELKILPASSISNISLPVDRLSGTEIFRNFEAEQKVVQIRYTYNIYLKHKCVLANNHFLSVIKPQISTTN